MDTSYSSSSSDDWIDIETSSDDDRETLTSHKRQRSSTSNEKVTMYAPCGIRCPNSQGPATLICVQCLVYYHPACVNLNPNLKIVGYVCLKCRSLIQQKNRRIQSSHTVVVGASKPEQQCVKPINIHKVHQTSDTTNFSIDTTPISKTEESNYEIDELIINGNNSDINTVTSQGNVYKTVMANDFFYGQYIYGMKQTQGPSFMTCVVQEPRKLDEYSDTDVSLEKCPASSMECMQTFCFFGRAMRQVFSYLNTHELLIASQVCTAWNIIATDKGLWNTVRLSNSKVYNWDKCIDAIHGFGSATLNTKHMYIPTENDKFDKFWLDFTVALKKAQKLKRIDLYKCPPNVIEDIFCSLPYLEELNATSIQPNLLNEEVIVLNLHNLCQLTQLTHLKINGLTGMKLTCLPSFENLVNLKSLSITSLKIFSKDVYDSLKTVTTNLTYLEIGDSECLSKDFVGVLLRLSRLQLLRLENCRGEFKNIAKEVFDAIRDLDHLLVLELINVEINNELVDELQLCYRIKALLIIPLYESAAAAANYNLIHCLKKLSHTLTHLIWGLTTEMLSVTNVFIANYKHKPDLYEELSQVKEDMNNIPILKILKSSQQSEEKSATDEDQEKLDVGVISIPNFLNMLRTMLENTKIKIVQRPIASLTELHMSHYLNFRY